MTKRNNINLLLFLVLSLLTALVQLEILQPVAKYQLIELIDDWHFLVDYKSLYFLGFFEKMLRVWRSGIHESGYLAYMGVLGDIFGSNYKAYNYVSIYLKIVSTITLFPLVFVVFKDRILAFLTAFFYGITAASTGSLYWVLKGVTFLGTALMNLFLAAYYLAIARKSNIWLLLSSVLLTLSFLVSAVRIYPVLAIVLLVEVYVSARTKKVMQSIVRTIVLFVPVGILTSLASISPRGGVESKPIVIFRYILSGNLHDLLSPIAGLGYSFFTNHYWPFFGKITPETFIGFPNYFQYITGWPLLIFMTITLVLSFGASRNWKAFFVKVVALNFFLQIIMYFIATYHFLIPEQMRINYDKGLFYLLKYPTLVGIYSLSIMSVAFLEWTKNKKNTILAALWVGPLYSLIFLVFMWLLLGYLLNGYNSTGYYYAVPSMGMSLMVAAALTLLYKRLNKTVMGKLLSLLLIAFTIGMVFWTSKQEIKISFTADNLGKVTVDQQMDLHRKIIEKLGTDFERGNLLIFFDLPKDNANNFYKTALSGFAEMTTFSRGDETVGCVWTMVDESSLVVSFNAGGSNGFVTHGSCILEPETGGNYVYGGVEEVYYDLADFRAFRFSGDGVLDVTEEIVSVLTHSKELSNSPNRFK